MPSSHISVVDLRWCVCGFLPFRFLLRADAFKKKCHLKWDLKKQLEEKRKQESAKSQLRKRSMDSLARPKAEKNILSNDPRMQRI